MTKSNQEIDNCIIGEKTRIGHFVNLYGCQIGKNCMIGSFVEIQEGVVIGDNVKVQSHSFICTGVRIEDNVFIGHHVVFTNDKYPRSVTKSGRLKGKDDWEAIETLVRKGASIGSNATVLCGVQIGEEAMVGAGSVVTKNVGKGQVFIGAPAKKRA